jgi:hypothetical protein
LSQRAAHHDAMPATHFTPWTADLRPCWHCSRFGGLLYDGAAASCSLVNGPKVRAVPERGCSAFEREVGADDVPEWVPVAISPMRPATAPRPR